MFGLLFSNKKSAAFLVAASLISIDPVAYGAGGFHTAEGHVNFFKHTGPEDDVYTTNPSSATVSFMNTHWLRLMTYPGYWDVGNKLSWYANAWGYLDSYALYSDPANTYFANLISAHPDWVLRDRSGNPLYINYACGGGTCPQYAANISNPAGFRAWWVSSAQAYFTQAPPFKGLFIDDVNLDLSRVSNQFGTPVTPIDPNTGAPMTNDAWRSYFADFMVQVRTALPGVEIIHNSLWSVGASDPNAQREILAADWINLERSVNDPGLTGGTGPWSLNQFLAFVDAVHTLGKGVVFDGEAPASDSNTAREYSVACYLLVSNGGDLVGDTSQTPSYWWRGFDADLGAAAGARYGWNGLLRRDFSGGIALVNPPGSSSVTVTLPGSFTRVDGSVVTSITLGPSAGAVLAAVPSTGLPTISSLWNTLGGSLSGKASVALNSDGRLEAFTRGSDNCLWHRWQTAFAGPWSAWASLGGSIGGNPAAITNVDGRLEAFAAGKDGRLWHIWQLAPSGNWSKWVPLGGANLTDPAAIVNPDGRVDIFVRNLSGSLLHISEYSAGGNWSRWTNLGGSLVGRPAAVRNSDGRVEVFAQGGDNTLWHISQTAAGGAWSNWSSLRGSLASPPSVVANSDGRLQVFAIGPGQSLWSAAQLTPGGAWSAWTSMYGMINTNPVATVNQDGRLEVFARGTNDGALWHIVQSTSGGSWAAWSSLGGAPADEVGAALTPDGVLKVFVRAADTSLAYIQQTLPGAWQ